MVIAVTARGLLPGERGEIPSFPLPFFQYLAASHPEHRFVVLFDRPAPTGAAREANLDFVVAGRPARYLLSRQYWLDRVLPPLLQKIGADVLIAPDGRSSLRTNVPQCLLVSSLPEGHAPLPYSKAQQWFFKWFTPKYFRKAKLIVTPSSFLKNDIIKLFGTAEEKIEVIHPVIQGGATRLSFAEQERLKEKYTGGKAFFISKGHFLSTGSLVLLLKAFSLFKKRQKSEMKLVLAGSFADKTSFLPLLKTFRYREDVILPELQDEADNQVLLASAYALILPPDHADFQRELLEGMQMRVPVLCSRQGSLPETGEDAALFFDPVSHEEMAETMMMVYKDENVRKECISRGEEVASKHRFEKMSVVFWDGIRNAASR